MKKIIKTLLFLTILTSPLISLAADSSSTSQAPIEVIVTEKVPWADCVIMSWSTSDSEYENPRRKCYVQPWMTSVTSMLWEMLRYFTAIWTLAWVMYIVINWIMLSMSWIDSWAKDKAKKWIKAWLTWLVLLLLSSTILQALFPWIYK